MMNPVSKSSIGLSRLALPAALKKQKQGFSRRHSRHECVVIGTMKVIDIGAAFDGALLELSRGGCTFRQASLFVLDRVSEAVLVRTEFFEMEGRIRAVRPEGYGVQFFGEIADDVIDRIVAEYGFNVAESFLAKRN
jgi:hypothetical protein